MNRREKQSLDRFITGNYGEDQFTDEEIIDELNEFYEKKEKENEGNEKRESLLFKECPQFIEKLQLARQCERTGERCRESCNSM